MDIKNAQEVVFNQLDGKKIMRDIFVNEREKERASKINNGCREYIANVKRTISEGINLEERK